jgi:hypothetical protein
MTPSPSLALSLVPYTPATTPTSLYPRRSVSSLVPASFFTHQTGTAIATELLYRLIFDILNRVLMTFQRLAARGVDEGAAWLGRKMVERRERRRRTTATADADADAREGLGIVEQVGKAAVGRGFVTCPLGGVEASRGAGGRGRGPQPPRWVRGVLEGIEEGRMEESDFWINMHTG